MVRRSKGRQGAFSFEGLPELARFLLARKGGPPPPLVERDRLRSSGDVAGGERLFYGCMAIGRDQYETWPQEPLDEMLDMQMTSERMSWERVVAAAQQLD
jgi:hypothetical protein